MPPRCSVINAIVAGEDAGGGAFSSPGQARVTRLSLTIGKVGSAAPRALGFDRSARCWGLSCVLPKAVASCLPALLPLPSLAAGPSVQAVEGQVNLEKLQQEAHLHNLKRKEVKALYTKASGWGGGK